jgi:hypothetical protein
MAKKITDELETIVKLSLSTGVSSDHFVPGSASIPSPFDQARRFARFSDAVQALCNVLEAVFIHGLKDPYFLKGSRYAKYPEPVLVSHCFISSHGFPEFLAVCLQVLASQCANADHRVETNQNGHRSSAGKSQRVRS